MPDVGPDSIPGTVAMPTWVLIAAIVAEALALAWIVRYSFGSIDRLAAALGENTSAQERHATAAHDAAERLEKLERAVDRCAGSHQ